MKGKAWIWVGALILLVAGGVAAYLIGAAGDEIPPGTTAPVAREMTGPEKAIPASREPLTEWYEAVGTVRPRTEARIEAQVSAQVTDVKVSAGERVEQGDILVVLDNRQFQARLNQARQALNTARAQREQARQAVAAAEAGFEQARADFQRIQTYFESQAATEQELERARAQFLQAEAGLKRAQQALAGAGAGIRQAEEMVREAEIALGYTTIRAPAAGEVLERRVDPGDLAAPGKPLILLRTAGNLRLEAYVREGLVGRVKPGTELTARLTTLGRTAPAVVEEIIPYADPQTRTFLVKAALPPIPELFPGMFGKLLIPLREVEVVMVPREAVLQMGQLEMVLVKGEGGWQRRFVKTGQAHEGRVEILSGLDGGEILRVRE